MKIYNEVVIDMNTGETIYEDSFEHCGPVALCGEAGSDKNRDFDKEMMAKTVGTLNSLKQQYSTAQDPFDSFYANEIERMEKETSQKKQEASAQFSLQRDQNQDTYALQKSQGMRSYDEMVTSTQGDIKRMQQESIQQVQDARASAADDAYAAMTSAGAGGLAASGGRARKVMARRAKQGAGKISMSLSQAKEQMDQRLRDAEVKRNQSLDETALGLDQKNKSAELNMDQTRSGLDRDLTAFTDKMLNDQANALTRIRDEARRSVNSTTSSFTDSKSRWGDGGGTENWSPWEDPFKEVDIEMGRDTDWTGV